MVFVQVGLCTKWLDTWSNHSTQTHFQGRKTYNGLIFFQGNICMLERLWLKCWAKDHEKILKLKAPILIALLILWTVEKHWICLSCVYTDKRCSGFHDHTSIKYIKKIWIKGCQQKLLLINMRKFWKVDFYIVNDLYLISWLFLSRLFLNEVALWSLVRYIGIISFMEKHRVKTYRIVSYILQKKKKTVSDSSILSYIGEIWVILDWFFGTNV